MTNEEERKIAPTRALSSGGGSPKGVATLAGVLADDWPQLRQDMNDVLATRWSARDLQAPILPI